MKDFIERFLLLPPFSLGCNSSSTIEVSGAKSHISADESINERKKELEERKKGGEEEEKSGKGKSFFGFTILTRWTKLIRSIKNLSQVFVYKEEDEDEDEETEEKEMEIGYPTDVKHVTHIGLDGTTTTNNRVNGWEAMKAPEITSSFPSISLRQFELAMAAQAHDPLVVGAPLGFA